MQARTSFTDNRGAAAPKAVWRSIVSLQKQAFRPKSLGLLALTFAVALFSYGYKVSQFRFHHESKVHFPVGKTEVEHRFGYVGTYALRVRRHPRTQLDMERSGNLSRLLVSTPILSDEAARVNTPARPLPFFDSALPLRSPPALAA